MWLFSVCHCAAPECGRLGRSNVVVREIYEKCERFFLRAFGSQINAGKTLECLGKR